MKQNLLVAGSSGLLGGNIVSRLVDKYNIFGIYKNSPNPNLKDQIKCDLTDRQVTHKVLESIKPDFVIFCVAITDVEFCESNYGLARETNATSVRNLLTILDPGVKFIYISTDSIFDGKKGDYSEADKTFPLNNYAKTKLEGEHFVEQLSTNYVILRTNFFGWNQVKGVSFAEWILDNLYHNKPISMFTDVIFSPVFVITLCHYIEKLMHINFVGRLNIGAAGSLSKYEFGVRLSQLFGFKSSLILPVSIDTFGFKAKRPKNMNLNLSKAKKILGEPPEIEEEIIKFHNKRIKY